jgi:hypothetical protein
MTVLLSRPYLGQAAGTVTTLPSSTESALIAQGLASSSAAVPTAGAFTTNATRGFATIAIGASSVVITNPNVDATSVVDARIAQAAADATLTSILRVVAGAGTITITGNANATAATVVSWGIVPANPVVFN